MDEGKLNRRNPRPLRAHTEDLRRSQIHQARPRTLLAFLGFRRSPDLARIEHRALRKVSEELRIRGEVRSRPGDRCTASVISHTASSVDI